MTQGYTTARKATLRTIFLIFESTRWSCREKIIRRAGSMEWLDRALQNILADSVMLREMGKGRIEIAGKWEFDNDIVVLKIALKRVKRKGAL